MVVSSRGATFGASVPSDPPVLHRTYTHPDLEIVYLLYRKLYPLFLIFHQVYPLYRMLYLLYLIFYRVYPPDLHLVYLPPVLRAVLQIPQKALRSACRRPQRRPAPSPVLKTPHPLPPAVLKTRARVHSRAARRHLARCQAAQRTADSPPIQRAGQQEGAPQDQYAAAVKVA